MEREPTINHIGTASGCGGLLCLSVFPIYSTNTSQESKHSLQAETQFLDKQVRQLQLGLMMIDRYVGGDQAVHGIEAGDYTETRKMTVLK